VSWLKSSPGKNLRDTLSQRTRFLWWCTPVIPAMQEVYVGGQWSEAGLGKKHETLSKND
jgi:hypothetical protein